MGNSPNEYQRYVMVQKEGGSGVMNIPFHSRIGTKLILGFLIVAVITGIAGAPYFACHKLTEGN